MCNLTVPDNFDQLKHDITTDHLREELKQLYGHPGKSL